MGWWEEQIFLRHLAGSPGIDGLEKEPDAILHSYFSPRRRGEWAAVSKNGFKDVLGGRPGLRHILQDEATEGLAPGGFNHLLQEAFRRGSHLAKIERQDGIASEDPPRSELCEVAFSATVRTGEEEAGER